MKSTESLLFFIDLGYIDLGTEKAVFAMFSFFCYYSFIHYKIHLKIQMTEIILGIVLLTGVIMVVKSADT